MKRLLIVLLALAVFGLFGLSQTEKADPAKKKAAPATAPEKKTSASATTSEKKPAGATTAPEKKTATAPTAPAKPQATSNKPADKTKTTQKSDPKAAPNPEKAMRMKFVHERSATIQKMKKSMDPKFMDLYSKMNRKKRVLREKMLAEHPEARKSKDPAVRRKLATSYLKGIQKKEDPAVKEYIQPRLDLDQYLFAQNPKLKEYFDQLDPKLRDKIDLFRE